MFNVNNRNAWKRFEIYLKLTTKTPERRHWPCSGVFIVNFGHISHLSSVFIIDKYRFVGKLNNNYRFSFNYTNFVPSSAKNRLLHQLFKSENHFSIYKLFAQKIFRFSKNHRVYTRRCNIFLLILLVILSCAVRENLLKVYKSISMQQT